MTADPMHTGPPVCDENDGDLKAPFCFEDESGGVFYIPGHLADDAAKIALALHLVNDGGLSADEAYVAAREATVDRPWYRDDPADEYGARMVVCEPPDDGAQPFTRLVCDA